MEKALDAPLLAAESFTPSRLKDTAPKIIHGTRSRRSARGVETGESGMKNKMTPSEALVAALDLTLLP
jgi:hypothetical protein